ncbi:bidirectional sugar transporter SWEET3b-like isoform X1 [Macadamia integrifolia]|uniref:bidirectional sugar transporter SWEET3b-like isoform X1 n=1 Tax=Macadamia integrifolia TaxID=60698 RepID=UPI001C533214|nr:bidirectional sugar transporter SWEET3b-like isoform X1 [Macadamia integrifolia]XP_042480602.1 bidirectional sugar transporter SWEET3b-like isoform X1 [Macadamia integrifolia]
MGGYALHLAVGIMGNATSLLLFAAPILTFKRVIRKRSTEEYSCVPYIVALFNCFLYTWYGLPVVSNKWENFPLVTINGLGVLMESTFIFIYFWFASAKGKKVVALVAVPVITAICITALVSTFAFHSHRQRKVFVGSVGLVACVGMYGSPLVAANKVMKTKSVEFMPFYLSLFSFLASLLWMTYGLLSHDLFLTCPNLIGCPLGIFQLMLYFMYRKKGIKAEPIKMDIESNGSVELKTPQPAINGTNGKI